MLLNSNVFKLPIKFFKREDMMIDTLYKCQIFGGYFMLNKWKDLIIDKLFTHPTNTYSVVVNNSDVEIYQVPEKFFDIVPV